MTNDKTSWTKSTLKSFESKNWLTDKGLCYGLTQIIKKAEKHDKVKTKHIIILPITYWGLFESSGLNINRVTSKLLPCKIDFYDIIFVAANANRNHWMGCAIFPKLCEIFELNSKPTISLQNLEDKLMSLLGYWT